MLLYDGERDDTPTPIDSLDSRYRLTIESNPLPTILLFHRAFRYR